MSMHTIIRDLRSKAGLSQKQLAAELGISRTAISHWESGRYKPDRDKLPLLAKILGCKTDVFFDEDYVEEEPFEDEGDMRDEETQIVPVESMTYVPLVTLGRVHAGAFSYEEYVGLSVEIPDRTRKAHPNAQAVAVEGDCLSRVIPDGGIAIYDPDLEPRNGSIAIVETVNHEFLMRRWHKGQSTLMLVADSYAPYDDIVITDDEPIRVVGTVVHAVIPDDLL